MPPPALASSNSCQDIAVAPHRPRLAEGIFADRGEAWGVPTNPWS